MTILNCTQPKTKTKIKIKGSCTIPKFSFSKSSSSFIAFSSLVESSDLGLAKGSTKEEESRKVNEYFGNDL